MNLEGLFDKFIPEPFCEAPRTDKIWNGEENIEFRSNCNWLSVCTVWNLRLAVIDIFLHYIQYNELKYCTCTVHTVQYSRCTCTVQYDILAISVKGEYLYHKLPPSISLKSQDLKISNINEKEALYILCTQTQTCATA